MENFEFLANVGLALVETDDFDAGITRVLALIGHFTDTSRTYLFQDSDDGNATSNTHEWCAEGVSSQRNNLLNIPYDTIPSWRPFLEKHGMITATDIAELSPDLIAALEPQGVRSLLVYPLVIEGKIKGFIGLDDCMRNRVWSDRENALLLTVTGMVATTWERQIYHHRLELSEANFKTLFNTLDELLIVGDLEGKVIHTNKAVIDRLGYTEHELLDMNILELHPEDIREKASDILQAMFRGERSTCPLELKTKDRNRLPVETRVWMGEWNEQKALYGLCKDLSREQELLQRFTRLFENNPAPMSISSLPERQFMEINHAFTEKLGWTQEAVVGKTAAELNLFISPEQQKSVARQIRNDGRITTMDLLVRHRDGSVVEGLFSGEVIRTQGKQYLLTVMIDITEQKNLQNRLLNIIEGTNLGTWEWNVKTGQTVFNKRWANIAGYTLEELEPMSIETWTMLAHPDDLAESERLLKKHFAGESDYYECESRMRHKNGTWIWVLDRGKVIRRDAEGNPEMMFGTHWDITDKKKMEDQIHQLSIRDPLTNVYNRRHLFERLESLCHEYQREENSFSLIMIDIDHFKRFNDTYGHLTGDFILKELTRLLGENLRPYDIVGRYGGEEFLVALLNTTGDGALRKGESLLELIRNGVYSYNGQEHRFTVSAGVAACSDLNKESSSIEDLVELADKRLYTAKNSGRDRIVAGDS